MLKLPAGLSIIPGGNIKFLLIASLLNGGTITGSIVPGYSDLTNSSQLPASIIIRRLLNGVPLLAIYSNISSFMFSDFSYRIWNKDLQG